MCNIGAMMHWCFDCTNKCHSNYFIYMPSIGHGLDWIWVSIYVIVVVLGWIGFRKLDPRPTLVQRQRLRKFNLKITCAYFLTTDDNQ